MENNLFLGQFGQQMIWLNFRAWLWADAAELFIIIIYIQWNVHIVDGQKKGNKRWGGVTIVVGLGLAMAGETKLNCNRLLV